MTDKKIQVFIRCKMNEFNNNIINDDINSNIWEYEHGCLENIENKLKFLFQTLNLSSLGSEPVKFMKVILKIV